MENQEADDKDVNKKVSREIETKTIKRKIIKWKN